MSTQLAIILDMDGLMLDTERISLRVWREAAVGLGFELDDTTCEMMIGRSQESNREMLVRRLGQACPVDDLIESAQNRYVQALKLEGVPVKPGLNELLHFLDSRGLPKAVATSTYTDLARHKLEQAGVLDRFDVVVGGDAVARGKPMPDIFLEAAARLARHPSECVVLEDSDPGIQAASAAGMRVILVPDNRIPSSDICGAAFAVVASLGEARAVIERLVTE